MKPNMQGRGYAALLLLLFLAIPTPTTVAAEANPIPELETGDIIGWINNNVNRGTSGLGFPLTSLTLVGMIYLGTRKSGISVGLMNILFASLIYFGMVSQEISEVMVIFAVIATASVVYSTWFKNKL